ncbi:MAG: toll/interleukin-1 receptor domain-containing protein [Pyrinomonadaceae bacterium]
MSAVSHTHTAPASDAASNETAAEDFSYDAFISYSGFRKLGEQSQFDRKVAERLHRSLEAYSVPHSLLKKYPGRAAPPRRLKKIFRDRDEVRASGNLNDVLIEALRRSRFLIVVCSPRARQSQWMNQEITLFQDLGRGKRILPLLIEGEPAEAFPQALFKARPEQWLAQPLAADVRAPSVSKSLRLLKQEKLRLLAPILGCEYDDLRQREHERFVRRALTVGVTMLSLLLVLTALSVALFYAQQKASRNAQLALNASAEMLPATALDPNTPIGENDPAIREMRINNAIGYLETLREDDPENLKCLTTLRALYGARASLLLARNRKAEAEDAFQKTGAMVIPITLSRLRSWRPTGAARDKKMSGEAISFPKDYDLKRLRTLLDIMAPTEDIANGKAAVEYAEVAAEYLPLLDTSTAAGRAEARRVLRLSLKRFQVAQSRELLTAPQQELVESIKTAFKQMPDDD